MDKYSQNILRTVERHIFTEKQIYHNKIKYSANDLLVHPKNMLCEVKNMFINFTALVKECSLPTADLVTVCNQNYSRCIVCKAIGSRKLIYFFLCLLYQNLNFFNLIECNVTETNFLSKNCTGKYPLILILY